jgi:predicted permease
MNRIGEWLRALWYVLNRRRFEEALREEMEAHRSSLPDSDRFGDTSLLLEDAREVWGWVWLDSLVRDVRLAARRLSASPGFTIVAVISLAVGSALVAGALAVINAYLVRPLPYAESDRLYHVMYAPPGPWEPRGMSGLDWSAVEDVVEFPVTSQAETFYLTDGAYAQAAAALRVSSGFVRGLGVRAVVGRALGEGDFDGRTGQAALIGHQLWRERYGSDPEIVGRVVRVDAEGTGGRAETLRVVGVLPSEFYFGRSSGEKVDLMVPLTTPARTYMVRLREGVPAELAERRITEAARMVATDLPPDWAGVELESAHERYVSGLRPVLLGIAVATGLVLVIVCANLAVLMLLRAARRRKEIAVRLALSCGRGPIARMLLVETAVVCVVGQLAGVALTWTLLRYLAPLIEAQLGRPAPGGAASITVDGTVLLLVGVVGVLATAAVSLAPLLVPWHGGLAKELRSGDSSTDRPAMRRLRSGLIGFEVAGTLVLLVACGLMIRSVAGMLRTDLGYDPEGLYRARVVLRQADYPDPEAFASFYEQFTDRLSSAARSQVVFAGWPPFAELPTVTVQTADVAGTETVAGSISIGAGYFATLGIPLRAGRDFGSAEINGGALSAVISETLAQRLWRDGSPIGRQVRVIEPTPAGLEVRSWRTVIAVAADVRQGYGDPGLGDIYLPLTRASRGRFGSFYLRSSEPAAVLQEAARSVASELDPHAIVDPPRPVTAENRQLAGTTLLTGLLSGFAAIAGFLAIIGIYGVTAYAVQQRERELAIRVALGATATAVVRLILTNAGLVLGAGVGVGLVGAAVAARLLQNRLYAIHSFDFWTFVVAGSLLLTAGLLASWWPARRASRKRPVQALRSG